MRQPPPIPFAAYVTWVLFVQKHGLSCGFWAAFFALGFLMGIFLDEIDFIYTPIVEVKKRLTQMYMGYVSNPDGIQRRTFEAELGGYSMDVDLFGAAVGSSTVVRTSVCIFACDSHISTFCRSHPLLHAGPATLK